MLPNRLLFLGTGDSQGVPRWWCDCSVCREARLTGINNRLRPSALIQGPETVLIDSTPEFRVQVERAGVRSLDAALITHAHNDHLLGIGDVADFAVRTGSDCPVFAPADVIPEIRARFGYMTRPGSGYARHAPVLPVEAASRTFAGYAVSAIEVPHGRNGRSWAYRFEREGRAWGYMSDCLDLVDLEPWRNLELLVLGASFYREGGRHARRSIYDVIEAAGLIAELKPARAVLTHLGHEVDVRKPAPEGIIYAGDGLSLELP